MTDILTMLPPSEFTITNEMRITAREVAVRYDTYAKAKKPRQKQTAEEAVADTALHLLRLTVQENIHESGNLPIMPNLEKTQILRFLDTLIANESRGLDLTRPPTRRYLQLAPQRAR